MSYPYHGEDFCLIHGREHMRSAMGNPIPWCEACEAERDPCPCVKPGELCPDCQVYGGVNR